MTQSLFEPSAVSTVWFHDSGLVVALVTLSGQNPRGCGKQRVGADFRTRSQPPQASRQA
jgi:hypothetical protein